MMHHSTVAVPGNPDMSQYILYIYIYIYIYMCVCARARVRMCTLLKVGGIYSNQCANAY
jgi:hypothetical protein